LTKTGKPFLVRRTCTQRSDKADEQGSHPLESYRDKSAYVLLGDPGAGKSESFKREAEESGGKYIRARDFATFEPDAKYRDQTLFIDGLDEMRADGADGRTPLDHIRRHLERSGRPRFRLSCREADWLGASDIEALRRVSPNDEVIALHLDPLSDEDIIEILGHKPGINNPASFMQQARAHGLNELLRNPQVLNLLVDAVGSQGWPQSRKEIYKMACDKLVRENSREHRNAERDSAISPDALLDAAGYLCAIHLLSGIAGYALDEEVCDSQHHYWKSLATRGLPLLPALKTNLFQKDGEEQRIPIHRSVAEYLAAAYLAVRIERHGLPYGRVLALVTGEDGGIVTDLRGLAAWLSVHCLSMRGELIARDPLGVVLYGDLKNFPAQDKLLVLSTLKDETKRYPGFLFERWSSATVNQSTGALVAKDMEEIFREMLLSPSRDEADQALLDFVLDALCYGEQLSSLSDLLEDIVRDDSYWPTVRNSAISALLHVSTHQSGRLKRLADDIRDAKVVDSDDGLLGNLLTKLFPNVISPSEVFDYLHPEKDERMVGGYAMFWSYGLPKAATKGDLPILLDKLVQFQPALRNILDDYRTNRMVGELLARGLEEHGDSVDDERLYTWLGVGLDEYLHPRLDGEYVKRISSWFAARPERYKAMIEYGVTQCITDENPWPCMNRCVMRLYASTAPVDIGMWYLKKAAAEQHAELENFYFTRAVHLLIEQGGQHDLTLPALEFLESWVAAYPKFESWLEPFITRSIGGSEQEQAVNDRARKLERQKHKETHKGELVRFYRQHIAAIRDGSAYPQIFYDLARAHEGLLYEASGETPRERMENFLAGDSDLIEAAYSGLRTILERKDLPSVADIVELELKGKIHFLCQPCLVSMQELFNRDQVSALTLPDTVLSTLLAFRLRYSVGNDPAWFTALVKIRPALVADVLMAYAQPLLRAKKEHVSGLYQLVNDDAYSEVARLALPKLLEGFPLRAKSNQLAFMLDPLLKGALHYLERDELAAMVARKRELGSIDAAQRVYWLSCGLLLAPDIYEKPLFQYVGKSEARRGYLANFIYNDLGRSRLPGWVSIPVSVLSRLIELLGPGCSNQRRSGIVTTAMRMADMVRSYINSLGNDPDVAATGELERLVSLPALVHWRSELRAALHSQRNARRKATFRPTSVEAVSLTLANLQPANAADLAALTFDHLCDIARKIRDGSTNDYKQYWSYDQRNKSLSTPKPENDCRDALLSDLNERLGKQGINAEREGNYADDKRADIKVIFGGINGFNVPIEIKKDCHDDLWGAIHTQLIPRYIRDPGAGGYGIYLVFWFGGQGMRPSPDGGTKPRSALELEERLRQTLSTEESRRILVCVIDCALP
jgi:hypothetical protein